MKDTHQKEMPRPAVLPENSNELTRSNRQDFTDRRSSFLKNPLIFGGFDRVAAILRSSRLRLSRKAVVVTSLLLVAIVGYMDYLTGYERPLALFYLLPIWLVTWFVSLRVGLGIAVLSVAVSILSDLAAGIPALRFWNAGMAFVSYALFAGVLAELRTLVGELDRPVQERTAALQREGAPTRAVQE